MAKEKEKGLIKRDEHTSVIMPEVVGEIASPTPEDPTLLEFDLSRTRKYAKSMLDRPVAEVWEEINQQVTILMLTMREASLKWLEIWTNSPDKEQREEAKHHFVALTREAANVTEQRQTLARSLGLDLSGEVAPEGAPGSSLPTLYTPAPMTKDDFEARFVPNAPKPILGDMRQADVTIEIKGEKK